VARALNVQAAAKVATALERIADGHLSSAKSVGSGVLEYKIDFGPGYRITLEGTATGLSFCSPVGCRSVSSRIFGKPD
jgi:putative addiction module killer protein